jgi:hypothetical protein
MSAVMLRDLFRLPDLEDFPGPFAERARKVALELRELWDRACRDAAEHRKVPELHAARDEYLALLEGHLRLLEEYLAVAELHRQVFGPSAARVDALRGAVGELRGLHDELFPRWQTADDLYRLIVEKLTPPAEQLKTLAAKYPPPESWLDETVDPFSAD